MRSLLDELGDAPFSARAILDEHPFLEEFQSCVIDLAYEEYCRRRDKGEGIAPTEFVRYYEGIEQSLYRVIEFDQVLHDHPSLIEDIPEDRWPEAGDEFCGFELLEQIGRGALSRVFVALQRRLGRRRVIVKICVRGEREAAYLGKLEHDGIAAVHSVHPDTATGLVAICMPYVTRATMHHVAEWLGRTKRAECSGRMIRRLIRQYNHGRRAADKAEFAPEEPRELTAGVQNNDSLATVTIKWGAQLARALHFAHRRGVLHCDVKPANVLMDEELNASLLDFNLAADSDDELALAGGTLPFMASEQLLQVIRPDATDPTAEPPEKPPGAPVDARTDVFGLCATLWQILSGDTPYGVGADMKSRTQAAACILFRQKKGLDPVRVRQLGEEFPQKLLDVLIRGLKLDPAERFASAAELADAFEALIPAPNPATRAFSDPGGAENPTAESGDSKRAAGRQSPGRRLLVLLSLGAVGAACLFPFLSDSRLTSNNAEEAARKARAWIDDGSWHKARNELESFRDNDALCGFLDLYCRTCLISGMSLEADNFRASGNQPKASAVYLPSVSSSDNLDKLHADWKKLAAAGPYAREAFFNLAFLELEFGRGPNFKSARQWFANASESNLETPAGERARALLRRLDNRKEPVDEADFMSLWELYSNEGTRGEFLLFLDLLRDGISRHPSPAMQDLLDRVLTNLETVDEARAEGEAARMLIVRPFEGYDSLRDRTKILRSGRAGAKASVRNFNRLPDVLVLPEMAAGSPKVTDSAD